MLIRTVGHGVMLKSIMHCVHGVRLFLMHLRWLGTNGQEKPYSNLISKFSRQAARGLQFTFSLADTNGVPWLWQLFAELSVRSPSSIPTLSRVKLLVHKVVLIQAFCTCICYPRSVTFHHFSYSFHMSLKLQNFICH